MLKRQKTEAIVVKHQKARRKIDLFNNKKRNYKSNIRNKTYLDQANYKYLLQVWETMKRKLQMVNKVICLFIIYL